MDKAEQRPGWYRASLSNGEVWLRLSNIEAVTSDGYQTMIVMVSGNKFHSGFTIDATIRKIDAALNVSASNPSPGDKDTRDTPH